MVEESRAPLHISDSNSFMHVVDVRRSNSLESCTRHDHSVEMTPDAHYSDTCNQTCESTSSEPDYIHSLNISSGELYKSNKIADEYLINSQIFHDCKLLEESTVSKLPIIEVPTDSSVCKLIQVWADEDITPNILHSESIASADSNAVSRPSLYQTDASFGTISSDGELKKIDSQLENNFNELIDTITPASNTAIFTDHLLSERQLRKQDTLDNLVCNSQMFSSVESEIKDASQSNKSSALTPQYQALNLLANLITESTIEKSLNRVLETDFSTLRGLALNLASGDWVRILSESDAGSREYNIGRVITNSEFFGRKSEIIVFTINDGDPKYSVVSFQLDDPNRRVQQISRRAVINELGDAMYQRLNTIANCYKPDKFENILRPVYSEAFSRDSDKSGSLIPSGFIASDNFDPLLSDIESIHSAQEFNLNSRQEFNQDEIPMYFTEDGFGLTNQISSLLSPEQISNQYEASNHLVTNEWVMVMNSQSIDNQRVGIIFNRVREDNYLILLPAYSKYTLKTIIESQANLEVVTSRDAKLCLGKTHWNNFKASNPSKVINISSRIEEWSDESMTPRKSKRLKTKKYSQPTEDRSAKNSIQPKLNRVPSVKESPKIRERKDILDVKDFLPTLQEVRAHVRKYNLNIH